MTLTRMQLGRCKYCGHDQGIEAENQYDADEEVTATCTCAGAERHRKFERAQGNIVALAMNLQKDNDAAAVTCLRMAEQLENLEKVLS